MKNLFSALCALGKGDNVFNNPRGREPPVTAPYSHYLPAASLKELGLVNVTLHSRGACGKGILVKLNAEKAKKIYDVIDGSEFWTGTALKEFRSNMNVTWRIKGGDEALEKKFIEEAKAAGMSSLKGNRSVGGIRASIYNAFPMEGVDALVSFMKDFEKKNG